MAGVKMWKTFAQKAEMDTGRITAIGKLHLTKL